MDEEIKNLADVLEIDISHACRVYYKLNETYEINCPRCKKLHVLKKLNYETLRYVRLCDKCFENKNFKTKRYEYPSKSISKQCECGGWHSEYTKRIHFATKKHMRYIENKKKHFNYHNS